MRTTSVICRFLSLLDVTLILLGLTMILMAYSQMNADRRVDREREAAGGDGRLPALQTVYLFAATGEPHNGRCFALGSDSRPDFSRPIRTEVADDVNKLLGPPRPGGVRVAVLLVSDAGFDSLWSDRLIGEIERNWQARVVPVRNYSPDARRER